MNIESETIDSVRCYMWDSVYDSVSDSVRRFVLNSMIDLGEFAVYEAIREYEY